MPFKPIFNLRPTTIMKAFFLNALLIGIISALTIETRSILNEHAYTKDLPDRPHKVIVTTLASVTIGFFAYILCRYLFGLGGGMLAPKKSLTYFL